jgi:hypothetical protein
MVMFTAEQLTLFAGDSPARTSAPPAKEPASTAPARASGSKCSASSEEPDPLFASLKTFLLSEDSGLMTSSKGWKKQATPGGRLWWVLSIPEPRTEGSGLGLLPTPMMNDALDRERGLWNSRGEPHLSAYVKLWPTPTTLDNPQIGGKDKRGTTLGGAVRLWTTPCADDTAHRAKKYAQGGTALSTQAGGALNPPWVEWLMGFPIGHTELRPLETPSSPPSPTPSPNGSTES